MPSDIDASYHPLLPTLKSGSDNKVANFNDHGKWSNREQGELQKLAESLKVQRVVTQINSIPDVWARPLLFEMALYDPNHLLHIRTLAEWRGLLAVLAFNEVKQFKFRIVEAVHRDENGKASSWPKFLEALAKMTPNQGTLSPDSLWLDRERDFYPYLILHGNDVVGMFSPTTLVCTSTDCFNRLSNIVWFDGRYLKDPAGKVKESESEEVKGLNQNEKKQLASWLQALNINLASLRDTRAQNTRLESLLGLLADFIADLGGAQGTNVQISSLGFGASKGVFRFIKPIADGIPPSSHVRLVPSSSRHPVKELYVVDPSIAEQWSMPDTHIAVYKAATLADVPFASLGRERKRIGNIPLQEKQELCLVQDILTPKLCVILQEGALPGAMSSLGSGSLRFQNQVVTPLLPLQPTILDHVDNEELQTNIVFEQPSDESINVRLKLRLSGPDGEGKFIELKREYRKDTLQVLESVPVLEIWPNFRTDRWKLFFTYFSKAGRESTFYCRPFIPESKVQQKTIKGERNRVESEIFRTEDFPTAILCFALTPNVTLNRMDEQFAGFILLRAPAKASGSEKAWTIGVDFGTTSTSVYYTVGENEPQPLAFRKELLATVTASGSERAQLYDDFIPGEDEEIPFLSFYQEFREPKQGQAIDVISDGHIFFLDESKELGEIAKTKNLSTNLKWSEDRLDRQRATAFLEQICIQALAEAASKGATKFKLHYSYPTAFSEVATSGLPERWQQIVDKAVQVTGLQLAEPIRRKSESHASAVYFADELKAPTNAGTVCIDIGGGTSDIAIWQGDQLRHQMSLRLAGRDLFLNTLFVKPDFLERFGTNISALTALRHTRIEFYAQADAIISRDGARWFQQLPNELGNLETKRLVQIIAIGISGLFYYIGLVMRYLMDEGKYKQETPSFYVGGNGSKMFHWLAAGEYTTESPVNELLRDVFEDASGVKADNKRQMKIVLSPDPKCEAARGLVGRKELDVASEAMDNPAILSGETILANGRRQEHTNFIDSSFLRSPLEVPTKLDQTKSFVDAFNRYASKNASGLSTIDLGSISDDLRKQLGGKLKDLSKKKPEDISVEPIFILSLKTLLEIATERWKNSSKQ